MGGRWRGRGDRVSVFLLRIHSLNKKKLGGGGGGRVGGG